MKDLLISDIEDTNVENCSSGEQKRLVLAIELTSSFKPNLIFIDEPTSGLDSNAAEVARIRYFILFVYFYKRNSTIVSL
jgi:ABC-type multidrug transport system ATPase subunit